MPPVITSTLLALCVLLAAPQRDVTQVSQETLRLGFFDSTERNGFQFSVNEDAYVAVFDLGLNFVELTYPAIGADLRRLRFGGIRELAEVDHFFTAGRYLVPIRTSRGWTARTRSGTLMKGKHVMIVVSKRPLRFERLNELYEGEGETFRLHNSLGVVGDLPQLLLRTILPDFLAPDWDYHLHWIRE